jgi:hypothetical protein
MKSSWTDPSGEWNDDDYDVLADGVVVGRIFKANAAPVGADVDVSLWAPRRPHKCGQGAPARAQPVRGRAQEVHHSFLTISSAVAPTVLDSIAALTYNQQEDSRNREEFASKAA